MLRPKRSALAVVGLCAASVLGASAAAFLAAPAVLACQFGAPNCPTAPPPPNTATIGALASIAAQQPTAKSGAGGGGWTGAAASPVCSAPLSVGEAVGVGSGGQLGWIDPSGQSHLIGLHGGGLGFDLPPIGEYYIVAVYTRTGGAQLPCAYSAWSFDQFAWQPVTFPDPTKTSLGPVLAALRAQVEKGLVAGAVETAPATNALVQLPTDAWVSGTNVSALTPVVATKVTSGPVVDGRQLEVTAVAIAQLGTVTWNWGDGRTSQSYGPDALGSAYPAATISHTYTDVSVPGEHPSPYKVFNSQGEISISATLNLQVYEYAIYDTAAGRAEALLATYPLVLGAQPHWVRVGQIEGVPYCPTTKTCA